MVLVLALGDLHIPHRAADLPPKFKSMLVPEMIQHVFCIGNLCIKYFYQLNFYEVQDYLKTLCDLHIIRGEYDEDTRYPETKTLTIRQFKLGLCHAMAIRYYFLLFAAAKGCTKDLQFYAFVTCDSCASLNKCVCLLFPFGFGVAFNSEHPRPVGSSQASADCYLWLHTIYVPFQVERKTYCCFFVLLHQDLHSTNMLPSYLEFEYLHLNYFHFQAEIFSDQFSCNKINSIIVFVIVELQESCTNRI
ncbi:hypothetical protein ES332_D06G104800v1 [Gossypium tomentosum]|uniref:Vacuolar protein sorting-associated protein 29 n=1 Tax=Gossypium tomentosum TaxID=34277 RepID=A0A5D2KG96_GOSTO|nr:hypothetical protein ES332_D06G104800v1 [Gossypium tomentosum]